MNKIKEEILFPEFCNLYGDIFNMKYLQKCLPDAEFINTSFQKIPRFVEEDITLIYMGPMTENMQEKVIDKLTPYTKKLKELINNGTIMLFTGNSMEILGEYIEKEDGSKITGLSIIPINAKRDMMNRFNCLFLGERKSYEIVGFKSQFTMCYGNNENNYFAKSKKGIGLNRNSKFEGYEENNFIGTYLLGPILILNPEFTKEILIKMGVQEPKLALEDDVIQAYKQRLGEFNSI